MSLHEVFRDNIRRRRKELGLTQCDLADKMGVSQAHVASVESGKSAPTLDTVEKFAAALNAPAQWLLIPLEPVHS
jgi:transcriptional regulator with XRE-family HTH domain